MNLYSDYDLLLDNLRALIGKDESQRSLAAIEIKAHVEAAARELSLARFGAFESELYTSIFSYVVKGEGLVEKLGGILAIRELIDCTSASAEDKAIKFAQTLAHALNDNTDYELIELVSAALGHMARNSHVSHVDYVENELLRALDWLQGNQSHRRFAACAVLQQLAENAPTIFFVRTKEFFDLIWGPLWDQKEKIRFIASRALSACLAVLRQRTYHLQWYCNIYDQIHEGFRKGAAESVHGSLLVVSQMLTHTGDFMVPRFKEVCRAIMGLQDHRSKVVRGAIASLIPALAHFCPDSFARTHLDESVDVLVKCSKVTELRQQALLSTGQLCQAVGAHLVPRMDELLSIVKEALVGGIRWNRMEVITEALQCVSDMVQGLGAPFHDRVLSLLEPMLQSGLTSELIDTLAVVVTYMPNQRSVVQQRLLEEATKVLGGHAKPRLEPPTYTYSWVRRGTRAAASILPASTTSSVRMWLQHYDGRNFTSTIDLAINPAISGIGGGMKVGSFTSSGSVSGGVSNIGGGTGGNGGRAAGGGSSSGFSSLTGSLKRHFGFFRSSPKTQVAAGMGLGIANMGLGVAMGGTGCNSSATGARGTGGANSNGVESEQVLLSLRTLGSLSHTPASRLILVRQSVLPYLASSDPHVRKEAAITCAKMISTGTKTTKTKGPTATVTEAIVTRLIEVIVSDPNPGVRLATLGCLHSGEFDRSLSRAHHIESLMFVLSDENFDTRIEALKILGRQAAANPSAVLPLLRLVLMRLISEIKNSNDNRLKEEATLMMCTFLRAGPLQSIVRPFMSTIICVLPLKGDVRLTTAGLEAVGELCMVLRQEMFPFIEQLLPVIIHNSQDSSSLRKQEMAVRTLGQLVSATGYVVTPYLQYPPLLPSALDMLFKNVTSMPWSLRREMLRTLGLLGALEPHRYSLIVNHLTAWESSRKAEANLKADGPGIVGDRAFAVTGPAVSPLFSVTVSQDRTGGNGGASHRHARRGDNSEINTDRHSMEDSCLNRDIEANETLVLSKVCLEEDNAEKPVHLFMYEQSVMRSLVEVQTRDDTDRRTPSNEDYFPRVVIAALMRILRDQSQSVHHSSVTQAIMTTFKSIGMHCVTFLDEIVPYLLQLLRRCGPGLRESLLQQLSELAQIVQYHLAPYLPALFDIIKEFWGQHLEYVLVLVESIAKTASDAFGVYVTVVLPLLLSSLTPPKEITELSLKTAFGSTGASVAAVTHVEYIMKPLEKTLACHDALRGTLQSHMHLVVPAVCKLINQLQELGPYSIRWQTMAVRVMRRLCSGSRGAVLEQSHVVMLRVVHTLTRAINAAHSHGVSPTSDFYEECLNTLCALGRQVGSRLSVFDSLIISSIEGRGFNTAAYRELSSHLHRGSLMDFSFADREDYSSLYAAEGMPKKESESDLVGINQPRGFPNAQTKLPMNAPQLAKAWDVSQRSTASDWNEWLRRLKVDLLRESPVPALRACSALAQAHSPLAQELFHAAFVSCWQELSEQYQDSLVKALQTAFKSSTIPSENLQTLLNLAEFMEHDVEALPISLSILAELAQKSHAYAKALHYRELEFQTSPATCFESLININKKLDQYDAAMGVIKVVSLMQQRHPELADTYKVQEAWLAKLGHWNEALEMYNRRLDINSRDSIAIAGKLKCLESLGRWEEAIKMCKESLDYLRQESAVAGDFTHTKAAVIGARAAWSLNEWELMDQFVLQLPPDNIDSCFMRAVLAVHNGNYDSSATWIDKTRKLLDSNIAALLSESYGRAYVPLILVQQCSELEEITEFNKLLVECTPSPGEDFDGISLHGAHVALPNTPLCPFSGLIHNVPSRTAVNTSSVPHTTSPSRLLHVATVCDASETGSIGNSALQALQLECHRRKQLLAEKWRRRIRGCASSGRAAIPVWKYLLNGRRMVLSEREDFDTWLEFAALCRHGGNHDLAERVLLVSQRAITCASSGVLHPVGTEAGMFCSGRSSGDLPRDRGSGDCLNDSISQSPEDFSMECRIRFSMLKQKWAVGAHSQALNGLDALIRSLGRDPCKGTDAVTHHDCLLKLGEWRVAMADPGQPVDSNTRRDVLALYSRATLVLNSSYRAWHQWGLSNYRAIEEARGKSMGHYKSSLGAAATSSGGGISDPTHVGPLGSPRNAGDGGSGRVSRQLVPSLNTVPIEVIAPLAVNTVKGLMRAVALGTRKDSSSVMEDVLCVLSTWFRYGRIPEVCAALEAALTTVHLDNWLGVLPQLIARIDHPEPNARRLLHGLLMRLGAQHSQALVYPLSVAFKSPKEDRKEAAQSLMASLRLQNPKLIDQALMVSHELVRMAILWQEEWHESLEEASKQYFGDGNIQGMLDTLAPLHQAVEEGPATLKEMSFCQAYGHDLKDAWESIKSYRRFMVENNLSIPLSGAAPAKRSSGGGARGNIGGPDEAYLHHAWDLYYSVFKRINAQLPHLTSLELQYCSPALLSARDMNLGVPGTYTVSGHTVRISRFVSTVVIIRSKQRPRRIRIIGEDGSEFVFLLKGHEDLRQDERAMQLFGLVNALLYHDRRTGAESHDLTIQRYAVLPLSPTAGLISWVPNCDTLHDLIRDYRESKKIMLNVEHKLMQQVAPNQTFDSLPLIHKLEVFEWALANTTGEDLSKILWLKSQTSEAWLHRRACYIRSLAVMSMVGYILGLGDRHPSNLMLDRQSGKVLHIDFGDCFEVAMQRDKFPEKVPFRLTRMLVSAMEASGIEGSYRFTSEKVMAVLRENREPLVATLEAFVHDPLITWRLLNTSEKKKGRRVGPEGANRGGKTTASTKSAAPPTNANAIILAVPLTDDSTITHTSSSSESTVIRSTSQNAFTSDNFSHIEPNTAQGQGAQYPSIFAGHSHSGRIVAASGPRIMTLDPVLETSETLTVTSAASFATVVLREGDEADSGIVFGAEARVWPVPASAIEDKSLRKDSISSATSSDPPPPPPPPYNFRYSDEPSPRHTIEGFGRTVVTTSTQRVRELHEKDRRTLMLGATGVIFDSAGAAKASDNTDSTKKGIPGVNPNLHLEMLSLVNSLQSPSRRSFSFSRRSVKDITRAQAVGGAEGPTQAILLAETLDQQEELTERAVSVIRRVMDKLTGLDFTEAHGHGQGAPVDRQAVLDVPEQVDRLIRQATASEHLCLSYFGELLFFLLFSRGSG